MPSSVAPARPGEPAWLCLLLATTLLTGLILLPLARPHRPAAGTAPLAVTTTASALKTSPDGPEDTLCRLDKSLSAALRLHGKRGSSSSSAQGNAPHSPPHAALLHRAAMPPHAGAGHPYHELSLFAFQEVLSASRPIRAGPVC